MELKSISLELKDIDKGKREIVFAHAVYNNIDHTGDISRKGMFNKSWQENKSNIKFHINHDPNTNPGQAVEFWEDETKAYTRAEFNSDISGTDAIEMVEGGIITSASFGYNTIRREFKSVKNRKIRELKEVKHIESSLLTYDFTPANSLTGVVELKSKDLLTEIKSRIDKLEHFCRNTTASDETILSILNEVDELKQILTNSTYAANAPTPEDEKKMLIETIQFLKEKHFK